MAPKKENQADVVIIGAGIVGLATALQILKASPSTRLIVLEKEAGPGHHQTGHNSGVIHSGIYYRPGSLKARLCLEGSRLLLAFCREHGIPFEICGKVVAAVDGAQAKRLEALHRRGQANGVPGMAVLTPREVRAIEPHVRCTRALWVPTTGIVDFRRVAQGYARWIEARGGRIQYETRVLRLLPRRGEAQRVEIHTSQGPWTAKGAVNCAGLYADRVARATGIDPGIQIAPFRGEYYTLRGPARHLVRNLIYPVPDPRFPFLGVHFTRMIHGGVEAGPNAVLAWAREGYSKKTVKPEELWETIRYPGFLRLALRYWRPGLEELARSHSKTLFAQALRRLIADIAEQDLAPGGAGVRAQALDRNGSLLDDFAIVRSPGAIHVLNAPSPAATSSLAIGDHISKIARSFLR
ncbi:L-2-hydroxyglutarate oxidase [Desulfacinum hydrothermale DSM 13146]|uniref:L-2-hydroxyglutarate oxidase n=1 Tax=Desulfacinum hydrothermale DSM 13146 TaxID=1121390 RepID=A0A1W1X2T1_9BACT|nr:L-2-hydroxyglutarate oxidase [Desulfacinum hydrothermale]SMC17711.1 L-2-hydroxyglutarate oxidase [Desulfacinum hydrothermale DSM 13146]